MFPTLLLLGLATAPISQAGFDPKDGFHLGSPDGDFLLRIGSRLQFRNTFKARDERGDTVGPRELDGSDEFFTEVKRARILFTGHALTPRLNYVFNFSTAAEAATIRLFDAYVNYKAGQALGAGADAVQVGAGLRRPFFLRQEPTTSGKLQFVERSLANEVFNTSHHVGAWLQGDPGPMFYAFFVTNGFDSINTTPGNVDQSPAFVGKLDWSILGDEDNGRYEESHVSCADEVIWIAGVSAATDKNNGSSNASGERFEVYQFGVDTVFKWSVLSLECEYMGRWLDYASGNTAAGGETGALYAHGFCAQIGCFLVPSRLEIAGRVSAVWTDTGPARGNAVEAGPGLNWFLSRSHKVKLQSNLLYIDIPADLPNASDSLDVAPPSLLSAAADFHRGEQGWLLETQLQVEF